MNLHIYNRYAHIKFDEPVKEPLQEISEAVGVNLGTREVYKESLIETAQALGIQIKRSWGVEKLQRVIDGHTAANNNAGA